MDRKTTTSCKPAKRPYVIAKRHSDPAYTEILLAVRDGFPGFLQNTYQGTGALNRALRACAPDYGARIESLIDSRKLPESQAKLWRQVPSLRFNPPDDLEPPEVAFGTNLYRHYDARGNKKTVPEALVTCDMSCRFDVPRWCVYLRDGKGALFPETPIRKPVEGLSVNRGRRQHIALYGNIYPARCAAGEIAVDMARIVDAIAEHHRTDFEVTTLPLVVTGDRDVFDTFKSQYAVLLLTRGQAEWACDELDERENAHAG